MNDLNFLFDFFPKLFSRNESLFYFGLINFAIAVGLFLISMVYEINFLGTHALYKPIKFGLSIGLYAWTMAWYVSYLGPAFPIRFFNWSIIALLGFEILYIVLQAFRAQLSHYNVSTPAYAGLYVAMAVAASLVTVLTVYVGYCLFSGKEIQIPMGYLWGIRIGIIIFVFFSFQGFLMGSRMSHTVGAAEGTEGLWFLNWSRKFGDLRVSHFLGMHALQVLPFLGFYFLKSQFEMIVGGFVYLIFPVLALVMALGGRGTF
jgi:hypothetical protein